jgi:AraC-like DNA-binding protein
LNLFINYQLCQQCKMLMKEEDRGSGLHWVTINVGGIDIRHQITKNQYRRLKHNLLNVDLESLDRKDILIHKITSVIAEIIDNSDKISKLNYSDYLSGKLNYNYTYLSNIFSEAKGITIQHFIIIKKIERVKELLLKGEMKLDEIAYNLHYSSVAHLSNQFKKITGFSISYYRKLKKRNSKKP